MIFIALWLCVLGNCFAQSTANNPFNHPIRQVNKKSQTNKLIKQPNNYSNTKVNIITENQISKKNIDTTEIDNSKKLASTSKIGSNNSQPKIDTVNQLIDSQIIAVHNPFAKPIKIDSNSSSINLSSETMSQEQQNKVDSEKSVGKIIVPIPNDFKNNKGRVILKIIYFLMLLPIFFKLYVENRGVIGNILQALTNKNFLDLLKRERNSGINPTYVGFYLLFFLILGGLCIGGCNLIYPNIEFNISNLLISIIIVAAIYLARHLLIYIVGQYFPVKEQAELYNFRILIGNVLLSILLLPILGIVYFGPLLLARISLFVGIALVLIVYLLRQVGGLNSIVNIQRFKPFHFLLYLAVFEVSPILLFINFINKI